jgi:predicted AAA+ superfamily ATPase
MNFIEFLQALNQQSLVDLIFQKDYALIKTFKEKYIEFLKQYYFVGGMPEAVKSFALNNDFEQVREIQKNILMAYEHDFAKHAPNNVIPRIRQLWNSIPSQLSKENKKFIFNVIREGARSKDYEIAIEWLLGSGLIHKVKRINKPGIPLKAYMDNSAFKIYMHDVGLLGALSGLDKTSIIRGNAIFSEFKGAITEQFVLQQIIKLNPYYWSAENSQGEIDFVVQQNGEIIPIEVKAEENLKAKSLKSFISKYKLNKSIRISMSDFRKQQTLINYPLYCLYDGFLESMAYRKL